MTDRFDVPPDDVNDLPIVAPPAQSEPARLRIESFPPAPLEVRHSGEQVLSFAGEVPVCIRVCEPICAESGYTIGFSSNGRPVGSITLSGRTRIFGCKDISPV
ncbi:MAG: hypothetical protein JWM27_298 [Gemmatimonadetes bacterium]|nr:hypothetical protein [Gemmatimonadota bacterium]